MKRFRIPWLLVLMACVSLLSPLPATAEGDDPTSSDLDGSRTIDKAFDYAMCAVSIASATTGWGIGLAVLTCGKALNAWWTE
jgi:hypothetical protein